MVIARKHENIKIMKIILSLTKKNIFFVVFRLKDFEYFEGKCELQYSNVRDKN